VCRRSPIVVSPSRAVEERREALVTAPAHRQAPAVLEDHDAAVARQRLDPGDPRQVDDERAVNPHEDLRIELRLDFGQRLLLQVLLAAGVEAHVVVAGLDEVERVDVDDVDLGAVADEDALGGAALADRRTQRGDRRHRRLPRRPQPHARDRLGEPLGAHRLQQIVDGVDLERAHRELVVRGAEDHRRGAADQVDDLEAVELRHLHVEEHEIGRQLGDRLHRLEAVGALGDDFDAGHVRQVLAQHLARERLVVDDDRPQPRLLAHAGSSMRMAGSRNSARNVPLAAFARS
jgi:hypothetical protein